MSDEMVSVPRDQLMDLIYLAEEALYTQDTEFSDPPTDKDRDLMLSLYRLVGKEIPPFFSRTLGWRLD